MVTVTGSVEFLQLPRLPEEATPETVTRTPLHLAVPLRARRWLELQSVDSALQQREVKYIAAEPFYLCARSIDWAGADSSFSMDFRPVYLRVGDAAVCSKKILLHVLLVLAVSSLWLLPYIAAFVTCVGTFNVGMHRFGIAIFLSSAVVCLAPLMLTQKNRRRAVLFFAYFFAAAAVCV